MVKIIFSKTEKFSWRFQRKRLNCCGWNSKIKKPWNIITQEQLNKNLLILLATNNFTELHNIVGGYNKLAITKRQIYANPIIHTLKAFFEKHKQISINSPQVQECLGVKKVTSAQQYIDLLFELHDGFWMDPKKQPLKDQMVISPKVLNTNIQRLLKNQNQIYKLNDYTISATTADMTQQFERYKKIQSRSNEGFLILSKLARGQTIRSPKEKIIQASTPQQLSPLNIIYNAGYISVKQIQGDDLILGPPNIGVLKQLRKQKERADLLLPEFIRNLVYTEEEIKINNNNGDPLFAIGHAMFQMFEKQIQKIHKILGKNLKMRSQRNIAKAFNEVIKQAVINNCKGVFRYQVEPDITINNDEISKKIVYKPDGVIYDDSGNIKMIIEYYITRQKEHKLRYLGLLSQKPYIALIGVNKKMQKVKIQIIRQLFKEEEHLLEHEQQHEEQEEEEEEEEEQEEEEEEEEDIQYVKAQQLTKMEGGVQVTYKLRTGGSWEYELSRVN